MAETSFSNTKEKVSVMKEGQGEMEKIMERMLEKFMGEIGKLRNEVRGWRSERKRGKEERGRK